jgi:hypothetical protein
MKKSKKSKAVLADLIILDEPVTERCAQVCKNGFLVVLLRYPRGEAPVDRGVCHAQP